VCIMASWKCSTHVQLSVIVGSLYYCIRDIRFERTLLPNNTFFVSFNVSTRNTIDGFITENDIDFSTMNNHLFLMGSGAGFQMCLYFLEILLSICGCDNSKMFTRFFYFFTFLTICLTVTSASIVVNETLYLSLCALRDSCVNESSEKYFHFVLFAAPILSRFYALIAKWRDRDAQVHSAS